jgi:hypothetical protein
LAHLKAPQKISYRQTSGPWALQFGQAHGTLADAHQDAFGSDRQNFARQALRGIHRGITGHRRFGFRSPNL